MISNNLKPNTLIESPQNAQLSQLVNVWTMTAGRNDGTLKHRT
jgi:hypothetical protein